MTLTTTYLGLKLAHPFILGASPVTGHVDNVRRAEDGGCAAVVMHSLFEETIGDTAVGTIPGFHRAAREFLAALVHFPVPKNFPWVRGNSSSSSAGSRPPIATRSR
ncbi:MAG TPA: hypothetical protein VHI98_03325 [Vicinamibacterales bacterium]|jgi:dihydroorotate dehydrogenase (fumarate)|nr:hypothetical protein [Vicinamibacterales bacterium]